MLVSHSSFQNEYRNQRYNILYYKIENNVVYVTKITNIIISLCFIFIYLLFQNFIFTFEFILVTIYYIDL